MVICAMTGMLAVSFALMLAMGTPRAMQNGARPNIVSYCLIVVALRAYCSPSDTPTPVGEAAFHLKLPRMLPTSYPRRLLEYMEDGLLECAYARLHGLPGGTRILTHKLGMSEADAEALFAAMEPQEGALWGSRAWSKRATVAAAPAIT